MHLLSLGGALYAEIWFHGTIQQVSNSMKTYPVHEDFRKLQMGIPLYKPVLPFLQRMTRTVYLRQSIPESLNIKRETCIAYDGYPIPIEVFSPKEINPNAPCLLFLHGGAFVLPAADHHKKLIIDFALGCSCKVVMADYRLAPRYPYPYGLEDCFSVYRWIEEHAKELSIDPERIAIYGDSAGGALTAGLTHLIRARSQPLPQFQMLIYPVLDARLSTDSMQKYVDTPIWNAKLNAKMWKLYLAEKKDSYASPNEMTSLEGLPNTYIEVNEFDCLRDEAIEYAKKLQKTGIEVNLVKTEGTVHGFELNYESSYTQMIIGQRIAYIKEQFALR